jgi:hypothetical protein
MPEGDGVFSTATNSAGVATRNCSLAPRRVTGVDHATTGIVTAKHVVAGCVSLQP